MRIFKAEIFKLLSSKPFVLAALFALLLNIYLCFSSGIEGVSDSYYCDLYTKSAGDPISVISEEIEEIQYGQGATYGEYLKYRFLVEELNQAESIAGYDEYLNSISSEAEKMTTVSLFSNKESFSYKNITSIPPKYEAVRGVKPVYAPSKGVLLTVSNTFSDVILLFVSFSAVFFLLGKEKEEGVTALIKSTRYGRVCLGAVKSAVTLLMCIMSGAVIYGSAFAIGALKFGTGDLLRPLQSIEGFIGCNIPISVIGGIAVILLLKITAVYLCSTLFSFLLIRFKNVHAYMITVAAAFAETAAYSFIEIHSLFSPFAYLNLAAFVKCEELFMTYRNFNFFGEPVNLLTVSISVCAALIIAALILNISAFAGASLNESRTKHIIPPLKYIPKSTGGYAAYKLLITHHGLIVFFAAIFFEFMFLSSAEHYSDKSDFYYHNYCNIMSEMSLEESLEYASDLSLANAENSEIAGFERAVSQLNRIYSLNSDSRKMFYQTGWNFMFGVNGFKDDMRLALVSIAAVCITAAPLAAYDKRRNMTALIYTSRSGKRKYFFDNIKINVVYAFLTTLILNMIFFAYNVNYYGSAGSFSSVRNIAGFEKFADMPIIGYIIFLAVLRSLITAIISCVILFISGKCKSVISALVISLVLLVLPIMIYLAGAEQILPFCVPYSINYFLLA